MSTGVEPKKALFALSAQSNPSNAGTKHICPERGGGRPRHHEVLIGIGSNERGEAVKVGAVIALVDKPHRIIEDTLLTLGMTEKTRITSLTDGDKMLRGYLKTAGLGAPLLDWAHLARRVQIAKITAKGLLHVTYTERRARPKILKAMDSIHWCLWHGNLAGARKAMQRIITRLSHFESSHPKGPACTIDSEAARRDRQARRIWGINANAEM